MVDHLVLGDFGLDGDERLDAVRDELVGHRDDGAFDDVGVRIDGRFDVAELDAVAAAA